MTTSWLRTFVAGLMLSGLGCARTVTVDVQGKGETPIPSHITYAVFPAQEVEKDSAFSTYARLIAQKMNEHGYKETESRTAKLAVYLAYGVSESSPGTLSRGASSMLGSPGGMGASGGAYGTSVASSDPSRVRQFTSRVVIAIGDLPKSREAGSLVELWRGHATVTGLTGDLPALMPLLVEAAFRHFGQTTAGTVQHTFGEEEIKILRAIHGEEHR
ncbi:MAG: hypothetical protein KatS3mg082_0821 [Nitrospiraceae bacterium]|nr:MAG: hypothetical protein KatS3mg082_0821 [Nitrospiraceae bacterium]